MIRVRKSLSGLSFEDKAGKALTLHDGLDGNASFPNPPVVLVTFKTAIDALKDGNTAIGDMERDLKAAREAREISTALVEQYYAQQAGHVESVSGNDRAKAETSGAELLEDPGPNGPLGQAQGLLARTGRNAGELTGKWSRVEGAVLYEVQHNTDPNNDAGWQHGASVSRLQCTLRGLPRRTLLWLRVRAIRGDETGPWSDPAEGTVK